MIYIVLFIYYVFLALLYDVGRYRRYRRLHFFVSLALMILVSGLRYRVGSDTVVYMVRICSIYGGMIFQMCVTNLFGYCLTFVVKLFVMISFWCSVS